MAEFNRVEKQWTPYGTITVSAEEVDALRNLLKYYFEGQKALLGSKHSVALKNMLNKMDVPGGPF